MKEIIECMAKFEYNVNFDEWCYLWKQAGCNSESMIKHMWDNFIHYNHSILALWGYSDLENQRVISEIIKNLNKSGGWDKWKEIQNRNEK